MFREKVLILVWYKNLSDELLTLLKKFKVDVVDVESDSLKVELGELSARYNTLIVDKRFCGNARDTAAFVRQVRQVFHDPIIGIDSGPGDGYILSLQVAGCNFVLPERDSREDLGSQVCNSIGVIMSELKEPHQQLTS